MSPAATSQSPLDTAITFEGLTKVFRQRWSKTEVRAVDDISLQVNRGTTYGLLGPNGAGKTTCVKLLLSCTHPTAGRAFVFGQDSRLPAARRSIGYLPENHRFPTYQTGAGMLDFYAALSGMDNSARRRRIPELLDLVGLAKWGGVRLGKYSKGMLQRVGLAQALMHCPQLLVLDEPSDGVDPIGRRQIRDILQALEEKGVTIFLNSHLLVEVELFCRGVAIINKGKVALQGAVRDLTAGSGYCIEAEQVPELLRTELARTARSVTEHHGAHNGVDPQNGAAANTDSPASLKLLYANREQANAALDTLRAERCPVESMVRVNSTLEDVFVRTINGK